MFGENKDYSKPEISQSCFNQNRIDEEEQKKAELQVKETIDFIANLFTEEEIRKLEVNSQSFKDCLLENTTGLYPSIAINQDIETYINSFKPKFLEGNYEGDDPAGTLFMKQIKEDLFVSKTTFIFNKKMELEIKEMFKNPLRLQNSSLGWKIVFVINFMTGKVSEVIGEKLNIPTKRDRITFEEQLITRYRMIFYRFKLFSGLPRINKFVRENKDWLEELKNKKDINSIDKQKMLIYMDKVFFPEDMFISNKGRIRRFYLNRIAEDWDLERNELSLSYKIQRGLFVYFLVLFVVIIVVTFILTKIFLT